MLDARNRGHVLFLVWEGLNIDGVDTEMSKELLLRFLLIMIVFYGDALGLASANLTETSSSGSGGLLNIQKERSSCRLEHLII